MRHLTKPVSTILALGWLVLAGTGVCAQDADDCLACHEDPDLVTERSGAEISLFIAPDIFALSVHADLGCVGCHTDLDGFDDYPHAEKLESVDCGVCHDDIVEIYQLSLHGQAAIAGEELAPRCWDCHGYHDIVPRSAPGSRVAKHKIPFMCGRCHKEGTAVTQMYDIHQDSILSHYSLSIHGVGLFQQGLTVTAVCSDCHTAHSVLPHTDPRSTIHRDNVAATCQKCHGQIERVHLKVIHGELWEKEPHKVPVCVDCHEPHEIRSVFYGEVSDKECMACHSDQNLSQVRHGDTISLYADTLMLHNSIHHQVTCAQCHTGISIEHERPCATVTAKVDCSICHTDVVKTYQTSTHGSLSERGDQNAPDCLDCHGDHDILSRRNSDSPTFPTNVPTLCAKCHREGESAAERYVGEQHNIMENYVMSIHGKGLLESGLIVTAMCTDCHTAHHVLPAADTASTVHPSNVGQTCSNCHSGIYDVFKASVHSPDVTQTDKTLPGCDDCHQAHTVKRTDKSGFKTEIVDQCGRCHEDVTESYFETFHGKVSKLGYDAAARCHDCHGAHNILPPDNPASSLSRQNVVGTCGQCHEGSHRQFAGYLTHATHHDRDKYPILFYTFWFMASLLIGTLVIAGTHTLLWLPRSIQTMRQHKEIRTRLESGMVFQRFKPHQRRLHILVIISFLGLALTGMMLKFSYLGWAQWLSSVMGGFETAAYVHRVCAIVTFFYFFTHLYFVLKAKRQERKTWKNLLIGQDSILFNKGDLLEAWQTIKWFMGTGPRPKYGRWTYWEKFDYFAVFWGVAVIGSTGLMLWFPEFFTKFLPGWFINVATIIHSDEALLAVAFIFTVHFFNTHCRPDKFPMDTVIFTGRMSIDELREERPKEYAHLMKTRQLRKYLVKPMPPPIIRAMRLFGAVALIIGLSLIILIIYAEVFGYR